MVQQLGRVDKRPSYLLCTMEGWPSLLSRDLDKVLLSEEKEAAAAVQARVKLSGSWSHPTGRSLSQSKSSQR